MVNYKEAFKRPFQDIKKLLIGTILYIIPIVNFLAIGYQLFCAKSAMKKDYKLPEWKNWGDLFVKGLLSLIISIIYAIPIIIISIFVIGTAIFAYFGQGMDSITTLVATAGVGIIILLIIALLTAYITPMAIMAYVSNFNFGNAFNFGIVFKKAFTGKYLITWLLMLLYGIIGTAIFAFIPVVGGALAGFIVGVTAFTAYGEVYAEIK